MREIAIEWSDVKRRIIDTLQDGKPWGQAHQRTLLELHFNPTAPNAWAGGSGADTLGWVMNGYFAEEIQTAPMTIPVAETATVGWSEEVGDTIDVGRLYGGYDDFYLEVAPSEVKPGLRVTADAFFAASVEASTVKQYGAWVAGLIASLEAGGNDLEVAITAPVDNLYEGRCPRTRLIVNVKRTGELSDFTDWSALFAPTGTRHVLFTAFGVASEKVGKKQTAHMATSLDTATVGWGVTYDEEANHLHISANQRQRGQNAFPAELMTDRLARTGLLG